MKSQFQLADLSLGLATTGRASRIPPGSCQGGSKNFWLHRDVLGTAPGFARITNALPDESTVKMEGSPYFHGYRDATGSLVNLAQPLNTSPYTIELVFRIDAFPTDPVTSTGQLYSTLLYKGSGQARASLPATGDTDYWLALKYGIGGVCMPVFYWVTTAPAVVGLVATGLTQTLKVGVFYHLALVRDAGGTVQIYLNQAGSTPSATFLGGAISTPGAGAIDDRAFDLMAGASLVAKTGTTPATVADVVQFPFRGVIQEVRYWKSDRTASLGTYLQQMTSAQAAAEADLVAYYRLTGAATNTYFYAPTKGAAGPASAQAPYLALKPRDATWLAAGHVLGNPITGASSSIDLDGRDQGFAVLDSYRYRSEELNQATADYLVTDRVYAGKQNARTRLAFSAIVRTPAVMANYRTLMHWTHVPDDQFASYTAKVSSTVTASGVASLAGNEEWSAFIDVRDVGGGSWRFRGGIGFEAKDGVPAAAYRQAVVVSNVALSASTEYAVTFVMDFAVTASSPLIEMYVDAASASYPTNIAQQALAGGGFSLEEVSTLLRATPDDPTGSLYANWMTIGRHIYRVRKLNNAPGDPNDVDVEYDFTRSWRGAIRRFSIVTSDVLDSELSEFGLATQQYVLNANTRRSTVTPGGLIFLSVWKMDDGAGVSVEDIGLLGNHLVLTEDAGHSWGRSGITTETRAPIVGLFEHRYREPTGEAKKICAVGGGAVWEINPSSGVMTFLADGVRNDGSNLVSTLRHIDSTILCFGGVSGNRVLWKDQLYRLSIDPPSGTIPWGLSEQENPDAAHGPGVRKWAFTFYSAHQNKRSPVGPIVTAEVWAGKACMNFGAIAEINQTRPTTGPSVQGEDFAFGDGSTDPKTDGFRFQAWYGATAAKGPSAPDWYHSAPDSTGDNEIGYKRLKLSDNLFITGPNSGAGSAGDPNDEVSISQIKTAMEFKTARARIQELPGGKIELVGAFAGALGKLRIRKLGGTFAVTPEAGGAIDWGVVAGGTTISGTGVTDHGFGLPFSLDPQVTHLEIWRTVAGGSQFRLVARVPNGTASFVDNIPDADLIGEILDVNAGEVPAVKYVTDFGGRAIYFGDTLSPQRVYLSEVGEPWNVPPQNTIDFLDGTTLEITGAARTEAALTLFKNDTTFVMTRTGDPTFPFQVDTRMRDIGCVSPRGIVNVNEVFYYPDEQGFYGYDTSVPRPISGGILDTWNAVAAAHYHKIVGVHDRTSDCIIWFAPSGTSFEADGTTVANDLALVWWYGKGMGPDGQVYGWSLLDGLYVKFATTIQDENEVNRVWVVDPMGYIYEWNSGTNYGVGTLTSRTPALAAGTFSTTQVTVAQATLANLPDGYKGLPVTVVKASTGERATRLCIADTRASPSVLTLDHALPFTPAATSDFSVIIGSIETKWISGEMSPAGQDTITKMVRSHMQLTPQAASVAGTFTFRWLGKYGIPEANVVEQSTTISNRINDWHDATPAWGLRHRFTFESLAADRPFEVRSIVSERDASTDRGALGNAY